MKPIEIVKRARSVVGQGIYGLGKGGRFPDRSTPFDGAGEVDCSGFVCWALGLDRKQGEDWLSTDGLIRFATARRMFGVTPIPRPGDIVVYGDWKNAAGFKKQGHTAIVTSVGYWGHWSEVKIVHASMGNMRTTNHAVAETGAEVFAPHPSIFIRRLESLDEPIA